MVVHPYHRPVPGQFPVPNIQQAQQAAFMMEMAKMQHRGQAQAGLFGPTHGRGGGGNKMIRGRAAPFPPPLQPASSSGPARLTSPSHAQQQQQQQSMAFQPPPAPAFQHFPPGATPFGIGMDWLQLLAAARQPSFQQSGPPPPPSASASQMPMAALPSTALAQSSRPLAAQPHSFGPGPPQANVNCQQRQTHCQSQQQQPNPAVPNPLLLAALAQAHQQQQQFVQQQQFALVKAAIEKEILELLNAAKGQQQQQNMEYAPTSPFQAANGSCGSPPFSLSSESQVPSREEDDFPLDLDLVEKQIAAQHNRLSAAEAEAVAVLAGLAAAGGVGR